MSDFILKFDQLNGTIDKFRDVSSSLTSAQSELIAQARRLSGMSGFGIPKIQAAIIDLGRNLARLGSDTNDIATFVSELQNIVTNYENKAVIALGGEVDYVGQQTLPSYSETGTDIGMVIDSAVAEAMSMYGDDFFEHLDPNVQQDLMFLTQSIFDGIDYEARFNILQHMHDNDGKITFDDLVRFGVFEEGDLRTGRWGRLLQRADLGGPRNFPTLLESEFRNTRHGSSLFEMDATMRQQRQAQVMGVLAVMGIGMAANVNRMPTIREPFQIRVGTLNSGATSARQGSILPASRQALHQNITSRGYIIKGQTAGGYVEYAHPNGAKVWIRPNGEVITIRREWLPDGSRKIDVRYMWDGTPVPHGGNNTGQFVEPIQVGTFIPPLKGQ